MHVNQTSNYTPLFCSCASVDDKGSAKGEMWLFLIRLDHVQESAFVVANAITTTNHN